MYRFAGGNSGPLNILANFLTDDVRSSNPCTFIDWINDSETDNGASNRTAIDKEGGKIILSDLITWGEEGCPEFVMEPEDLKRIILKWHELLQKKPDWMLLRYNDEGKIVLEGVWG